MPYRVKLFNQLAKSINVTVVTLQDSKSDGRSYEIEKNNFTCIELNRCFKRLSLNFLDLRCIDFSQFDCVVVSDNLPNFLDMIYISKKIDKNLVLWSEVSNYFDYPYTIIHKLLHYFVFNFIRRKSSAILVFNDQCFIKLLNKGYKVHKVAQAHDNIREFSSTVRKNRKFSIGFIGYFSVRKGIERLLNITNRFDCDFYIAGAGEEIITQRVIELSNSSDNVNYLGFLKGKEKKDFFGKIDFLIVPSKFEPWGLVVNEAIANGVIPLVSKGVLAKEMLPSELVFDVDDEHFFSVLESALSFSDEEYQLMIDKLQNNAVHYSIESSAKSILRALEKL